MPSFPFFFLVLETCHVNFLPKKHHPCLSVKAKYQLPSESVADEGSLGVDVSGSLLGTSVFTKWQAVN